MAHLDTPRPPVHPGVDAQSWLGFEQRVQARRFDALLASARDALAAGNVALAEHALAEAREIRTAAPEIAAVELELRRLRPSRGSALARRAGVGFGLLILGALMVIALDGGRLAREALPDVGPPEPPSPVLLSRATLRAVEVPFPRAGASATSTADVTPPPHVTTPPPQSTPSAAVAERTVAPVRDARPPERPIDRPIERPQPSAPAVTASLRESESLPVASPPALLPPPTPASPPPAAAPPPTPTPTPAEASDESRRVAEVLRRYAAAYGNLDVRAARDVWPNVDQRALARAFDSLASQTVSFDSCDIDVRGAVASASCRGQASYVGKVGRTEPRTEPRTWRFELRRDGERWTIERAEARRGSGTSGF